MKKNRRGLGRGLGALIQSTVPDEDLRESDDSSASPAPEETPRSPSDVRLQPPVVDAENTPAVTDPEAAESSTAQKHADEVDIAAGPQAEHPPQDGVDEGRQTSEDGIAQRYLSTPESAPAQQTHAREARRPVDVFFPDRRTESPAGTGERKQPGARPATSSNGRRRPTMPSLEPRAVRSPKNAEQPSAGADVDQPEKGDQKPDATDSRDSPEIVTHLAAETRFSGTAGTAELRSIAVADIHPNPRQPREVFDEDDMDELVASIREVGVLQPIVVRPVEGLSPYELVMGERRWRASQRAGLEHIPAIVRHTADTALLRDALLENLHRSQLNPLEEAAAYEQLLEDFECTQDELSNRIGRSRPQISNTLRLLKLPPLVQRRVASGVLSAGHARALLGLVDPGEMEKLAQKIVSEGLSVRATEELVSLHEGVRQAKSKPRAPRTERHERLDYLANSLTDQLDTTVKITLGARKGKIAIDFASVEDLNRIMALIDPSGSKAMKV